MKSQIVAKHKEHLQELIIKEISDNGNQCSLNHIDVSKVDDMEFLFSNKYLSDFNGDISEWDVSNVRNMNNMFDSTKFNGDISRWNVSKVESMSSMFYKTIFNGDISKWDTSSLKDISYIFTYSQFEGDISNWNVSKVENMLYAFCNAKINSDLNNWKPYKLDIAFSEPIFNGEINRPYWAVCEDNQQLKKAIDTYHLKKELNIELVENNNLGKKIKI